MKYKFLILINLVLSFVHSMELDQVNNNDNNKKYILMLEDSSKQEIDESFIKNFKTLEIAISDTHFPAGDLFLIPNLNQNKFNALNQLLLCKEKRSVIQEFNKLKLQDQIELLRVIDFLDPKNDLLGDFSYGAENYLMNECGLKLTLKKFSQPDLYENYTICSGSFSDGIEYEVGQNVFSCLENFLQKKSGKEVLDEFNKLGLEYQLGLLKLLNSFNPKKTFLGKFESRSNNSLIRQFLKNLYEKYKYCKDKKKYYEESSIDHDRHELNNFVLKKRIEFQDEVNSLEKIYADDGTNFIQENMFHWGIKYLGKLKNYQKETGHVQKVLSVALSKDGRIAVTGSYDRRAIVWIKDNHGDWKIKQHLGNVDNENFSDGHVGLVSSVALSENGNVIVTGSHDKRTIVWIKDGDQGDWKIKQHLGNHDNNFSLNKYFGIISSVALSQDGKILVTGSDKQVTVWVQCNDSIWRVEDFIDYENQISSVALSQDGNILVVGFDKQVKILVKNENARWIEKSNCDSQRKVSSIAITKDGQVVVAGLDKGAIVLVKDDECNWAKKQFLPPANRDDLFGSAVAISEDGELIVSAGIGGEVVVWEQLIKGQWEETQRFGYLYCKNTDLLGDQYSFRSLAIAKNNDEITIVGGALENRVLVWEKLGLEHLKLKTLSELKSIDSVERYGEKRKLYSQQRDNQNNSNESSIINCFKE